ncbi:MAG TPA: primosomal protein N' [Bacteroidia bacterium]|nr:primosomal protein N' [Bacteroidia bacterium]
MKQDFFADIILPLPLGKLYTYSIPEELVERAVPGVRAVVQFGKHKLYTGIIRVVHKEAPEHYTAKPLLEIPDHFPVVTHQQFRLWDWIAEYYLCSTGEIMQAALPSAMKLQSETVLAGAEGADLGLQIHTDEELKILKAVAEKKSIDVAEASKISGLKNPLPLLRRLMDEGLIVPQEEMRDAFMPAKITFVKLTSQSDSDPHFMKEIFERLEKKAPKQLDVLMTLIRLTTDTELPITRSKLIKASGSSAAALNQLVTKGVVEMYEEDENHAYGFARGTSRQVALSEFQMEAYELTEALLKEKKPVLLHGVTSSGKTEIYIRLINDLIGSGKQVLYLLPEIALTTQIIGRLKEHFGDQLLVYHSRLSANERASVYMKVLTDGSEGSYKFPLIIGARSAVFLPFSAPGLIIVDEEHDGSYKQMDPAPRYHGRDVAVMMGNLFDSGVLLGSATPSIESYANAEQNKYALVKISQRFGGIKMPEIEILDLKDAYQKGAVKSNFSFRLSGLIKEALERKEQIILFQNRRGFAPVLECRHCGWIPQCINCDVSLTYHKKSNHLRCHYCGYSTALPGACMACNHTDLRMKGLGTERIEDDVQELFPDAVVQRLDLDTTSTKHAFQRIISGFSNREIDILVGTQMITKGLDFDNVSLVGVLNADHLIGFPDFRAAERSYQLLAQVAGRSGRRFKQGKVLIQAFQVGHPLLKFLVANDYAGFFRYESNEREKFSYPPFVRLIEFRLRHRNEQELNYLSEVFVKKLKSSFGKRVFGPVVPPVGRVRNYYIRTVLLKLEKGLSDKQVKNDIRKLTASFLSIPEHRSVFIQFDVDPM